MSGDDPFTVLVLPTDLVGTNNFISACPTIQSGPGRVVPTTVNHLNDDLFQLGLENSTGASKTLGVPGYHPFHDVTDGWTQTQNLHLGEKLPCANGTLTVRAFSLTAG